MGLPWRALSSAASGPRELQTAVTCPCRVALMAAIWAVAAQPYPMTATLWVFIVCCGLKVNGGRSEGDSSFGCAGRLAWRGEKWIESEAEGGTKCQKGRGRFGRL